MEDQAAKGKGDIDHAEICALAEKLSEFKEINLCRLFCDDITPEKLASIERQGCGYPPALLAALANPPKTPVLSSGELGVFFMNYRLCKKIYKITIEMLRKYEYNNYIELCLCEGGFYERLCQS